MKHKVADRNGCNPSVADARASQLVDPLMAGLRPSLPTVATRPARLPLELLCDLQSNVDLDPETPASAFEFRMAEKELNSPENLRPPVD